MPLHRRKEKPSVATAVGEPENTMKHRKALLSEEEERDNVRKVSKRQEQNQTHMAKHESF